MTDLHTLIGFLGVALIVGSYLLLQAGRLDPRGLLYSAFNGLGAALVIVSLLRNFNFPAFLIEGFWLLISIYGLIQWFRRRSRAGC